MSEGSNSSILRTPSNGSGVGEDSPPQESSPESTNNDDPLDQFRNDNGFTSTIIQKKLKGQMKIKWEPFLNARISFDGWGRYQEGEEGYIVKITPKESGLTQTRLWSKPLKIYKTLDYASSFLAAANFATGRLHEVDGDGKDDEWPESVKTLGPNGMKYLSKYLEAQEAAYAQMVVQNNENIRKLKLCPSTLILENLIFIDPKHAFNLKGEEMKSHCWNMMRKANNDVPIPILINSPHGGVNWLKLMLENAKKLPQGEKIGRAFLFSLAALSMSLHRFEVKRQTQFFPFVLLVGGPNTYKTTILEHLMAILGLHGGVSHGTVPYIKRLGSKNSFIFYDEADFKSQKQVVVPMASGSKIGSGNDRNPLKMIANIFSAANEIDFSEDFACARRFLFIPTSAYCHDDTSQEVNFCSKEARDKLSHVSIIQLLISAGADLELNFVKEIRDKDTNLNNFLSQHFPGMPFASKHYLIIAYIGKKILEKLQIPEFLNVDEGLKEMILDIQPFFVNNQIKKDIEPYKFPEPREATERKDAFANEVSFIKNYVSIINQIFEEKNEEDVSPKEANVLLAEKGMQLRHEDWPGKLWVAMNFHDNHRKFVQYGHHVAFKACRQSFPDIVTRKVKANSSDTDRRVPSHLFSVLQILNLLNEHGEMEQMKNFISSLLLLGLRVEKMYNGDNENFVVKEVTYNHYRKRKVMSNTEKGKEGKNARS